MKIRFRKMCICQYEYDRRFHNIQKFSDKIDDAINDCDFLILYIILHYIYKLSKLGDLHKLMN